MNQKWFQGHAKKLLSLLFSEVMELKGESQATALESSKAFDREFVLLIDYASLQTHFETIMDLAASMMQCNAPNTLLRSLSLTRGQMWTDLQISICYSLDEIWLFYSNRFPLIFDKNLTNTFIAEISMTFAHGNSLL